MGKWSFKTHQSNQDESNSKFGKNGGGFLSTRSFGRVSRLMPLRIYEHQKWPRHQMGRSLASGLHGVLKAAEKYKASPDHGGLMSLISLEQRLGVLPQLLAKLLGRKDLRLSAPLEHPALHLV